MRGNSHVRFGGRGRADRLAQTRYGGSPSTLPRRPRRLCHGASTLGSPLPPATSYGAAWPLPRPDFHRQVHRRLQDTHRGSKFTPDFDEVFRSEGIQVIKAPVRVPKARAHAERWVGSVRRECLNRLLILGRRHLHHVLAAYVRHFNEHRPHRALGQQPPLSDRQPLADVIDLDRLRRRDRLGGLIHEYQLAA